MITNNTYQITDNGLLTFPELETRFGIKNLTTYDNNIWSDMAMRDSSTDSDKTRVLDNRIQLRKLLDSKIDLDITTPVEDTLIHYDKYTHYTMVFNDKSNAEYKSWSIRSNSIILDKFQDQRISVSVEPRDCPIIILAHPVYKGLIFIHAGLSQIYQRLIEKTMNLFSASYEDINTSEFSAFVTPFISTINYPILDKVIDSMKESETESLEYMVENDKKYHFDFKSAITQKLSRYGITNINFTDICTYESAKQGHLYSFRLYKDVVNGLYPNLTLDQVTGNFTVVVSI